jgi:hypothetical protein
MCKNLPKNPYQCKVCNIIICKEAILPLVKRGNGCLNCQSLPQGDEKHTFTGEGTKVKRIAALMLQCPFQCRGQEAFLLIKDYDKHAHNCT